MTTVSATGTTGAALVDRVVTLSALLRDAGIATPPTATVDAVRVLGHLDLARRDEVREGLAAVLTSAPGQRPTFDALFDALLPAAAGTVRDADGAPGSADRTPAGAPGAADDAGRRAEAMLDELVALLLAADDPRAALRRLARAAVDAFGRLEGRDGVVTHLRHRVLAALDLDAAAARAAAALGLAGTAPGDQAGDAAGPDALARRLALDEVAVRLAAFRDEVAAEVARREAARRGPTAVAASVPLPLEELDLFRATPTERAALEARIRPLARRIATRAAARRRTGRDGRLDVRRTVRRSLSTGGVPLEPVLRPLRPHRPELVVVCDVSGSVAAFARFTLLLVHALQERFARVRTFAFIDDLDEVTDLLAVEDPAAAVARLHERARVVRSDGHSDYGHVLGRLRDEHADAFTRRTTVLVLGDARTNHRPHGADALQAVARRARRVLWLNPEPRAAWDTGDSVAGTYARLVDRMVEVRNLRQLAAFVEQVA